MKFFLLFLGSTLITALLGLSFKLVFSYLVAGLDQEALLACFWGFRFDLAIAAMLNTPLILLAYLARRIFKLASLKLLWFFIPIFSLLVIQLSDALYALNAQKHITGEAAQFADQFFSLLAEAINQYGLIVAATLIGGSLLAFLMARTKGFRLPKATLLNTEGALIVLLLVEFLFIRSYLTGTPLRPSSVYQIGNTGQVFYAMNGAYSTVYHLFKSKTVPKLYLEIPKPVSYQKRESLALVKPEQPKYNVVLFLLESWPAKYSGFVAKDQEITPFLNELSKQGLSSYAMLADGKRTHEGLFATLCSAHNPLGEGLGRNNLNNFEYHCLPEILGLQTTIFQGTTADLVGDLALQLGVNISYGRDEIEDVKLPFNTWGVQDEDLLNFILKKAKQETDPFFYVVNTTTTHDFVVPDGESYKYGRETEVNLEKSLLNYVDKELKEFYQSYTTEIQRPTIFVFLGDHTRIKKDSDLDEYSVPFLMVATDNSIKPEYLPNITSQLDIAPTLLGLFKGYVPWFQGTDLLKPGQKEESRSFFKLGNIEIVHENELIVVPLQKPKKLDCYSFAQNQLVKPQKTACSSKAEALAASTVAETWLTQDLLFKGKLTDYHKPLKK